MRIYYSFSHMPNAIDHSPFSVAGYHGYSGNSWACGNRALDTETASTTPSRVAPQPARHNCSTPS